MKRHPEKCPNCGAFLQVATIETAVLYQGRQIVALRPAKGCSKCDYRWLMDYLTFCEQRGYRPVF
jgi:C4-type Zn-finger protein